MNSPAFAAIARLLTWLSRCPNWLKQSIQLVSVFFFNYVFICLLFTFWIEQVHALGHQQHQYSLLANWLKDNYALMGPPAIIAGLQLTVLFGIDQLKRSGDGFRLKYYPAGVALLYLLSASIGMILLRNDLFALPAYRLESPFALTAGTMIGLTFVFGIANLLFSFRNCTTPIIMACLYAFFLHLYWFTSPYYYMVLVAEGWKISQPIDISKTFIWLFCLAVVFTWAVMRTGIHGKVYGSVIPYCIFMVISLMPLWTALKFIMPHHHLCLHNGESQRIFAIVMTVGEMVLLGLTLLFFKKIKHQSPRMAGRSEFESAN